MLTYCYEYLDIVLQMLAITVRVWCCHGDSNSRLCILWDVHLSGLVYLAGKVSKSTVVYFLLFVGLAKCTDTTGWAPGSHPAINYSYFNNFQKFAFGGWTNLE